MPSSRHFAWAAAALMIAAVATAAGVTGADAIKARQTHMKALGASAKAIFQQTHAATPDMAVVKAEAAKIDAAAKALPTWFPAGSGAGAKTEALPLIWTDPKGFAAKQHVLALAAAKLNAVAQAGDAAGVGPAAHDVGAACKGCHETYKEKDKT